MVAVALAVLVAIPLLILFIVIGIPWWPALIIGALIGGLIVWWLYATADQRAMPDLPKGQVSAMAMARFENLIEGLCLSIGISEPDHLVVRSDALNAMAVARKERRTLVVTDALLEQLERIELEGVLAELLVRLKTGDAEAATVAASVIGKPLLDSPLAGVGRSIAPRVLPRLLDQDRDVLADRQAVSITRYPPGLSAALVRMADGPSVASLSTAGTDHLWMAPPSRMESILPTAPLDWRIDILLEI